RTRSISSRASSTAAAADRLPPRAEPERARCLADQQSTRLTALSLMALMALIARLALVAILTDRRAALGLSRRLVATLTTLRVGGPSALATGYARFFARELVGGAGRMSRLATLARDLADDGSVHRSKAAWPLLLGFTALEGLRGAIRREVLLRRLRCRQRHMVAVHLAFVVVSGLGLRARQFRAHVAVPSRGVLG